MNNDEKKRFKELADKYNLQPSDFWKSPQGFVIISRRGIEKIQNGLDARIVYEVVPEFSDAASSLFVVKATGEVKMEPTQGTRQSDGRAVLTMTPRKRVIETFGESSPKNTRGGAQAYPVAMAEKRALSRCILKLSDFYTLNVLGEDEISD